MSSREPGATSSRQPGEIDSSFQPWLVALLLASGFWLVLGLVFSLIGSIKFHGPNFLADTAWLTYGRVRPAHIHCLLYGFCVQAGVGLAAWIIARLGRVLLSQQLLACAGLATYNLGVLAGVFGILRGDASGYEFFEAPDYAAAILFAGYLLMAWVALLAFHRRERRELYVSQWFLVAGLFWFPWIFSTAGLLLLGAPVRGVAQSVIAWWYAENLQVVWCWLVGLATVFYFIPKLTNRALYSHYLALFTFWTLVLFGSWGGIPNSAPLPSWMPVLSTVASVLGGFVALTVFLNLRHTLNGGVRALWADTTSRFIALGTVTFFLVAFCKAFTAFPAVAAIVDFTWFRYATTQLNLYGFFGMVLTGGAYYALSRLPGLDLSRRLAGAHFWLSLAGVVLGLLPLIAGGVIQGLKLQQPDVAFVEVSKLSLHFLRVSTIGELLLLAGSGLFLVNLAGAAIRQCRPQFAAVRQEATRDLFAAAEVPQ